MNIGLDIGTMFLVKATPASDSDAVEYASMRNVFLEVLDDPDTLEFLDNENIEVEAVRITNPVSNRIEVHKIVVGDAALKLHRVMENAMRARAIERGAAGT